MKKNNPIIRTCMVCRTPHQKQNLLRFIKTPDGEILFDKSQKNGGRGCYICNSSECLSKLKKTRAFNRAFKENISEDVYDRILRETKQD